MKVAKKKRGRPKGSKNKKTKKRVAVKRVAKKKTENKKTKVSVNVDIDPRSQLILRYEEEIEFLRSQIKDLQDRLLSFFPEAYVNYKNDLSEKVNLPAPSYIDPLGKIQSMDANTEDEKKQKEQAEKQMRDIISAV